MNDLSTESGKPNLILLGGPGAGKGTQAEKLKDSRGLTHLATGDILREEVAQGTDLGRRAKGFMDKGELVPDELVIDMVRERLGEDGGYLFDGFPRTVDQAEALEEVADIDLVLFIDVGEEEIVRRLSARRLCEDCGAIYNLLFKKPEEEGVCDECGGELIQRDDDKPEVIRDRYATFMENTAPLIDYYRDKGNLAKVDGEVPPDQVHANIEEKLEEEL